MPPSEQNSNAGTLIPFEDVLSATSVFSKKQIILKIFIINFGPKILLKLETQAYVKVNFAEVNGIKDKPSYGCGCLTDGKYKIEVHVETYRYNFDINRGDKVEVFGKIQKKSVYK